jgi:hypothetical protein
MYLSLRKKNERSRVIPDFEELSPVLDMHIASPETMFKINVDAITFLAIH